MKKYTLLVSVVTCILVLTIFLCPNVIHSQNSLVWTAYNDCNFATGQHEGTNITKIASNSSGTLIEQATGNTTGITASFTRSGTIQTTTSGEDAESGTDSYNTFYDYTDLKGVINGTASGWYIDLTLSGLDPSKTYTFAGSATRNGTGSSSPAYSTRNSTFILSGDESASNASTSGVTVVNEHTIAFNTGTNKSQGYVVRWIRINPGSDGTIVIRTRASSTSEISGSGVNAYGLGVFMLAEEQEATDPTIVLSGTLNSFTTVPGITSTAQSYNVSGYNLTENINISAPEGFELSTNGTNYTSSLAIAPTDGSVPVTTIYVRLYSLIEKTYSGNIIHTSTGASVVNLAVNGTVTSNVDLSIVPSGDAYISEYNNTNNYGASATLKTTCDADNPRGTLFIWDLSRIPDNAIITSASFTLYVSKASSQIYNLYNMRRSWAEGTGSGEESGDGATWLTYNGTNTWGAEGVTDTDIDRYDINIWEATSGSFSSTGSVTIDLNDEGLNVVQGWVNGTLGNYGVILQNYLSSTSVNDDLQLASSENTTIANRPKLNITYRVSSSPNIIVNGSLNTFNSSPGTPSTEQSYTLSASNLTNDLIITAPLDFEISTTSGTNFSSIITLSPIGSSIAQTTIYVRFNRASTGTSNGNITHMSDGASTQNLAVSGTATIGWVAFNDCAFIDGQTTTNITTYECYTNNTTGLLKRYADGLNTPVTLTVTTSGTVDEQLSSSYYGAESDEGTDAYNTFHGYANMVGGVRLGSADSYVDLTFTGLDAAKKYTFVTSANRDDSEYTNRRTLFTLSDVESASNASSSGVIVKSNLSVAFCTGYNTENGYVVRWNNIESGLDGDFTVRFAVDTDTYAYGPSVFMLQESPGEELIQHTLTITNDGNGTVTLNPSGGIYYEATTVTLTPVPNSGFEFSTWGGINAGEPSDNGNGTWSLIMNGDKSLVANFSISTANIAPNLPALIYPADNASGISTSPTLTVTVSDPNVSDSLDINFYGRENGSSAGPDFTIVVIPDIQNESQYNTEMLSDQMNWIVAQQSVRNIIFATSVGDLVNIPSNATQYNNADAAFDILDAGNIPYSVGPGNHDMMSGTLYENYFGISRFSGKSYYGGNYGSNNFNSYSLFSASGNDFILINLQYSPTTAILNWADALLKTHSNRRAIIEQHDILNTNDSWNNQTSFTALKDNPNLFLMLCGHMHSAGDGAAYREELGDDGHTIHVVMSDYQDINNGDGYLRILQFSAADDMIYMTTYSPYASGFITTSPDQKNLVYDLAGTTTSYEIIGSLDNLPNGINASISWPNLNVDEVYEWYTEVSDGKITTTGPTWSFTTSAVPVNQPPVAVISADPLAGFAPLEVTFTGSASSDPDGSIVGYDWDLADGTSTGSDTVIHTYNNPGTYHVVLTVTDNEGATGSDTIDITVNQYINQPPVAVVSASPVAGFAPLEVTFIGSASSDPDGTIVGYDWDLADGTSTGSDTVIHSFNNPGTYQVILSVTDNDGDTDSDTVIITVYNPALPIAVATATPTIGKEPLEVTFIGSASSDADGVIVDYLWDLSDGTIINDDTIIHTYNTAGIYQVILTVTDDDGLTNSDTLDIIVNEPVPPIAKAIATPIAGTLPVTVNFAATSSSDADGYIVTYSWDLADGTIVNGDSVSHAYTTAGIYEVILTVTDNDGLTDKDTISITVAEPIPTITITSPSGGENWRVGTTHDIAWIKAGTNALVNIDFTTNNGFSWVNIASNVWDNGSYSWTVPNIPSSECLIRIQEINGLFTDVSDAVFTISTNTAPVITSIPNQSISEGASFANILLDNYVTDTETPDASIVWSVAGVNQLIVGITNRVAAITTPTNYWSGSDTITFVAYDNDTLNPLSASADVIFTVSDLPICYNETFSGISGTVSDNSGSGNYVNNMSCQKLIQPAGMKNIILTFTQFNTESGYDFVRVYNGSSTSDPLLGSYSGGSLPASVTATNGSMLITFITDHSVVASGWSATYTSNNESYGECTDETLTDATGTITDNSGSNNYINNMSCRKLIQPAGMKNVILTFTQFNTESGYDFVRVYNGPSTSDPLLGSYSGGSLPASVTATNGSMLVTFTTDHSVVSSGWNATYTSNNESYGECKDETLADASGTITDNSGSNNYINNMSCRKLIQPTGMKNVILTFNQFSTESGYDFVRVYNGSSTSDPLLGSYSGGSLPASVTATNGSMLITFITDHSVVASGWSATYTSNNESYSECTDETLTDASGTITDNSGSNNYVNNMNCQKLIQPVGMKYITLSFTQFSTESGYDFVRVYNGTSTSDPLLGQFSGSSLPSSVIADNGSMLITFITDHSVVASGWSASYTSNNEYSGPCINESFATTTGTINDNSGSANYMNNMSCQKLIQPAGMSNIVLTFSEFNTEADYDIVRIYDGATTSSPLLGRFSGTSIPTPVIATSGSMLITFNSDYSIVRSGWSASYTSNNDYFGPCIDETFADLSGTITDNSGAVVYTNYMDCDKLIQPSGAASITLTFTQFNTESGYDFVRVYDGPTNAAPLLGQYSGTSIPPAITSTGGSMLIRFTTDYSVVAQGWIAQYVTNTGNPTIKDAKGIPLTISNTNPGEMHMIVYPNPVKELLTIESNITDEQVFTFELVNTSGQTVLNQKLLITSGKHELDVSAVDDGLYILKVTTDNKMEFIRIIKN